MELILEKGAYYIAEGWETGKNGIIMYWQWEMDFLMALQNGHVDWLTAILKFFTTLGNAGICWIVLSVILAAIPKSRKCGFTMMLAMALTFIIGNLVLKNWVARFRPCWIEPTVEMLIKYPKDYSFPSGHTMNGATASIVILFYTIKNKKTAILGILAVLCAGIIAFSRMYLFVHWPTDIIFGALIGAVDAVISFFVIKKIYEAVAKRKAAKIGN